MSKDIWHNPPQTPDVFKSHPIIVLYEAGDQIEQMDSKEYSDLVGERYVNRWCYVDELIKENDRTRKASDVAVDALKSIDCCGQDYANAQGALEEIIALEQKKSEFTHNKIEFPEYNDGLLEEFDKQFFENGQDDDLTETALEQKDIK